MTALLCIILYHFSCFNCPRLNYLVEFSTFLYSLFFIARADHTILGTYLIGFDCIHVQQYSHSVLLFSEPFVFLMVQTDFVKLDFEIALLGLIFNTKDLERFHFLNIH